MKILVYDGETFERWRNWYIGFWVFVVLFILFNIFIWNFFAVIFFLILVAWYLYLLLLENRKIYLEISPEWLYIWNKLIPWNSLEGFVLELTTDGKLKNIVFVKTDGSVNVYTLADDLEKIKDFVMELSEYTNMLDWYKQSFFEKLLRILKL